MSDTNDRQIKLLDDGWTIYAFDYPVEVFPRIWLSGILFEDDFLTWCVGNNFTHVINASGINGRESYYISHPNGHNLSYLDLNIHDDPTCDLNLLLSEMYIFLRQAYKPNGKILVHCVWGKSRSVSCLIYFEMVYWGISYDVALEIIRRSRPTAKPNRGFEHQLRLLSNINMPT